MKSLLASLFFIFTLSIAAVETKEFKIDLPRDWKVEKIKDSKTDYRVIDKDSKTIFTVTTAKGGPEFIMCFCTPKENYQFSQENNVKIWTYNDPNSKVYTIKTASKTYRTDIHLSFKNRDKKSLLKVIKSIRAK